LVAILKHFWERFSNCQKFASAGEFRKNTLINARDLRGSNSLHAQIAIGISKLLAVRTVN